MNDNKKSAQMTLNVIGFVLIVLGLGLEGGYAFFLLGLAVAAFVAALFVAAATAVDENDTGNGQS
jgi:glycosyltransferase A (GT-A) superfamily protein (DUF2064 family)